MPPKMMFGRVGRYAEEKRLRKMDLPCRPCGARSTYHLLERTVWIGFVLPLFPIRVEHHVRCELCWSDFEITRQDALWLQDPTSDLSDYVPQTTVFTAPGGRY